MNQQWVPKKPNFGPPPSGYIAGIGRGATGFQTRSDIGPAKGVNVQAKQAELDDAAYADSKYDSWSGYKGALFVRQQLDEQDKQAEEAYDYCERRIQERRPDKKQDQIAQQLKKHKKDPLNMPISELFIDLKRDLAKVTEQQWANIPDATDMSIKKQKKSKYTPVPDSLLTSYISTNINNKTIAEEDKGREQYREAKSILLKTNLQKAENQNSMQSEKIDRVGYLTHLDTSKRDEQFMGDVKRARLLHKSAIQSNPKNADIWLSAARIEELDGKVAESRQILRKALQYCSTNEDIWIELSRIERADQSKNVLIESLRQLPKSQKIWLSIAKKQSGNKQMKSKILRRALQNLPQSSRLWKELIELQDLEQARRLLYKAVQCLPKQIDLWVGLAKLENYENAKAVLNKARKANPLSLAIWINAAKLEETQSDDYVKTVQKIEMLIKKARSALEKNGNAISRDEWLQQALICQKSNNICTCQSIIKASITLGLTEQQLNHSIFKDVDFFQKEQGSIFTTRFLYKEGIKHTKNPRLLQKLIQFQERLSLEQKQSEVVESMNFGLKIFPDYPVLWFGIINRFIENRNFQKAQALIINALQKLSKQDCQLIQLRRVYLLKLKGQTEQARKYLEALMEKYPKGQSAIQAILLQYQLQDYKKAWKLCSIVFKQKNSEQVWQLAIKIKQKISTYAQAKALAEKSVQQYPNSIRLWKLLVQIELNNSFVNKARSAIDKALMKNPKNEQLYLLLVQMQIANKNKKQAISTIEKALKQCPKSGQIWSLAILLQPHGSQKKKASVAVQHCGNCSQINLAVAQLFETDNKIDKARKWLEQGIKSDRGNGDLWGYYYRLIGQHYPKQSQIIMKQFNEVEKVYRGRKWNQFKENKGMWKFNNQQLLQLFVVAIAQQQNNQQNM